MHEFICPVCKDELIRSKKFLKCKRNHSYDISRHGYVNLLMSNASSSKRHGDDRAMVNARRNFLDQGYYNVLIYALQRLAVKYSAESVLLLDVGCGECWYTEGIKKALEKYGRYVDAFGIDISKWALKAAALRDKNIKTAVASAYSLPIAENVCDIALNIFAPCSAREIFRVLKDSGIFIRVIPLENHLMGLKKAVYDKAYKNDVLSTEFAGFYILESMDIKDNIKVMSHEDICNLFMMTPYYYKTGALDQAKLNGIMTLNTEIEFRIIVYKKLI